MAASSAIGSMLPTSMFAHITLTSCVLWVRGERGPQICGVDETLMIDRQPGHLGSRSVGKPERRVENGVVFHG